jgi:hypothetical protein
MKKQEQGVKVDTLRAKRFPSGNPDLMETNAIPRDTDYDLTGYVAGYRGEFTARVPKPGNCVRKDGFE